MPESPRWLASKGRFKEADQVVKSFEDGAIKSGKPLPEPVVKEINPQGMAKTDWRELFRGIYRKRTFTLWGMWFCVYMVNNAMVTWLPSLYKQHFGLSLQTSLGYGWITSGVGVIASIICALMIDKVGRRPWYSAAFFLAIIPLMSSLGFRCKISDGSCDFSNAELCHFANDFILFIPLRCRTLPNSPTCDGHWV